MRVAVVGGGMSGIACAARLYEHGADVVVHDRGHRLGGRMATMTMRGTGLPYDGRAVDVGAAYLTVSDAAFADQVSSWSARGLVAPWTDTFHLADEEGLAGTTTGPVRYAAPHGLRSLVEDLAGDLPRIVAPHEVESVDRTDRGVEVDGVPFDAAVLALPGPQALDLLGDDDPATEALEQQEWLPTLTLVAAYAERCWDDLDAVFAHPASDLVLVADDGRRRGDGAPVLVAHSGHELAARHLDDPQAARDLLVDAVARTVGTTEAPQWTHVRRWSLAKVANPTGRTHWYDGRLGLCGDAWSEVSRVEAAYVSGRALADALLARG